MAYDFRGSGAGKVIVLVIKLLVIKFWAIKFLPTKNNIKEIYFRTETAETLFASLEHERIDRNDAAAQIQTTAEFSHICAHICTHICAASAVYMRSYL